MNSKKIGLFLLLSFIMSWLIAGALYLLKIDMKSVIATVILIVYMYMPALTAFIVQKLIYKESMIKPLMISFRVNWFFLWALLLPLILVFLATLVGFLFPGIHYTTDMSGMIEMFGNKITAEDLEKMQNTMDKLPINPVWLYVIQGLIAAITINALAAFGEELGWRGFLLSEFRNLSFVKASILIGIIWGLWHAPIILMGHNFPQHPQWGVLFMIIFCTLYTFLFLYITIKTKSVIAASVMHGSVNAFWGITIILSSGGNDLIRGISGAAGFVVLLIAILVIFVYDKWISKEGLFVKKIGESLT